MTFNDDTEFVKRLCANILSTISETQDITKQQEIDSSMILIDQMKNEGWNTNDILDMYMKSFDHFE